MAQDVNKFFEGLMGRGDAWEIFDRFVSAASAMRSLACTVERFKTEILDCSLPASATATWRA